MIDLSKVNRSTRDGTPVKDLYTREHREYPIIGKYRLPTGEWETGKWTASGYFINVDQPHHLDLVLRKNEKPNWTKKKPTKEGWYWHVDEPGDEPVPCIIFLKEGTLSFISIGWSMDVALAHIEGLFYGPIEMPEGPDEMD